MFLAEKSKGSRTRNILQFSCQNNHETSPSPPPSNGFHEISRTGKMIPFSVHLWQKSVTILLLSHWSRWWSPQSPCTLLKARACIRVIPKVTPYPLFQWSTQSKKNLLNLNIPFKNNYSSCTGTSSEDRMKHETQFTTKIGGKTSLGPIYFSL
jgi:hypothetical protein